MRWPSVVLFLAAVSPLLSQNIRVLGWMALFGQKLLLYDAEAL